MRYTATWRAGEAATGIFGSDLRNEIAPPDQWPSVDSKVLINGKAWPAATLDSQFDGS